jgi:hypothetical protein
MTIHQSPDSVSQGNPNLGFLEWLQSTLGTSVIPTLLRTVKTSITADATGGKDVDIPVGAKIIDVRVLCTSSNGSGTATVKTGSTTISNAIACVTNDALARAASLDTTYTTVGTAGINIVTNGAADRGDVYIDYLM